VHRNWENCASQVGLALGPLRSCMQSGQGAQLLADSYQRAADKGIKASPTILLGAAPYLGRRTADSLVRAICEQFPAARPAVCLSLPQLPTVRAVILSDRRCKQCDGARLDAMVRNRVANPQVRFVDYAEPEGRQLYDALRPGPLPVLLFDASLEADAEAFKAFERSMRTEGTTRIVSSGGDWNPRCHDENGCAKAECADDLTCRRDKPKRIELYTMSLCPFAARAVVGLRELLQDLEPGITVQVQFIGTGDAATGFDSMRGADEVLEDLRQACAVQHYRAGNKFLQYMGCRAQKVRDPDWKACTGGTSGIDARVLQRCAEGAEGKRLLEASFRYARRMGVQGSPTWLLNDRVKVMGADMDVLKKQFCSLNPAVRGCQAPPP
jgi:2-hydroxychromene-2-carboxylate isomerase